MKTYSNVISLVTNSRGVSIIDPTMGCKSGIDANKMGCYGDCYSANAAKRYGIDFGITVLRRFKNESHRRKILAEIAKVKLPFIRMGGSGDPSEDWEHTISVCEALKYCNKEIVIITKHWNTLTTGQLDKISRLNICINTSVSALDEPGTLAKNLYEYSTLKQYCKSILRVVTCDFNEENDTGNKLLKIQESLLDEPGCIDTVFRPSKNNPLVIDGVINVSKQFFNGGKTLVSKHSRKVYTGHCSRCIDLCGTGNAYAMPNKMSMVKQLTLFEKI